MKKGRFDEMRNASNHINTKQKEVIQIMRKDQGTRSWMSMIAMVVALTGASLFIVQVAGAVTYTISATVTGSNGTISPSGNVSVVGGTDKTFTITPNADYAIRTLKVDNVFVQPSRTYRFTRVSAAHSIVATFALDSDKDGIPDDVESATAGITVWGKNYPPCPATPECVSPNQRDVFVVLVPAPGGHFSTLENPLEYVTKSVSAGGLPLTVHWQVLPEGSSDTSNRFLSGFCAQKYVRITESLNMTGDLAVLGSSTCGTPDQDLGTVYTERIEDHVNSVYSPDSLPPGAVETYIKHTIAHELGHMVGPLAPAYNANYGGYHYASAANDQIMNQFVYSTGTGAAGDVILYIGTSYTSADQAGIKLK